MGTAFFFVMGKAVASTLLALSNAGHGPFGTKIWFHRRHGIMLQRAARA